MTKIQVIRLPKAGLYTILAIRDNGKPEIWHRGTTKERAIYLAKVLRREVYPV